MKAKCRASFYHKLFHKHIKILLYVADTTHVTFIHVCVASCHSIGFASLLRNGWNIKEIVIFRRLREKKNAERLATRQQYKGTMERIFSLERYVDLATLQARPSAEFLSFLQMNSAPEAILKEVCRAHIFPSLHFTILHFTM